jgi:hypothetical protein
MRPSHILTKLVILEPYPSIVEATVFWFRSMESTSIQDGQKPWRNCSASSGIIPRNAPARQGNTNRNPCQGGLGFDGKNSVRMDKRKWGSMALATRQDTRMPTASNALECTHGHMNRTCGRDILPSLWSMTLDVPCTSLSGGRWMYQQAESYQSINRRLLPLWREGATVKTHRVCHRYKLGVVDPEPLT